MNRKTLVLGASLKPNRYSYFVIQSLVSQNVEVKALGLKSGVIFGVVINAEMRLYECLHTVTIYIKPSNQKEYYDYIIRLNPKRVIFNPGTENTEFFKILKENNICFEMACTLVLLSTNQY